MKTVALVQARLGSSRLPMKSLICLRGLPLIDWVIHRVAQAELVDQVVAAVPDTPLDRCWPNIWNGRASPASGARKTTSWRAFARRAGLLARIRWFGSARTTP